ncbi:hypothetical protein LTR22_026959 [Elasticomyces elasticus]|nr:hypothetical protein LTR22_026959 [Elasticomyces elasticus]KAK4899884.1 hypothetical protein LTR49_027552 [Elasticomyces elasticus]
MAGMVFREFVRGWTRMQKERVSAATLHHQRLQEPLTNAHWAKLRSNLFCSICILRRPEHVLKCRHAICDHCARTFGEPRATEEYTYIFRVCVTCGAGTDLLVRLKPPTAGIRILSVDGGGVRGIVPLEFLHLLQRSLGSSCRLQDLFDLALGTSAGGLVVLGLFAKSWDIPHAVTTFRALAVRLFARFLGGTFPALGRFNAYVRCMLQDSCYKTESLDATLKESFGEQTRIFDYPESGVSQCKIAVTTTTTSTATTRIIANYNGITVLKSDCGYTSVRPEEPKSEPLIWQALFAPLSLPGLGTFQDGALRHNNPVNIALWEGSRIWARDTQRDVVLSLGTGTGPEVVSPQKTPVRTTFKDGFIPRLCRSFMTGLDGEMTWKHLLNHMEKDAEHRYFRLNVQLGDCEPRLDDITSMAKLSEDVISSKNDRQLTEIKFALLASSFFFELKRAPKFDASGFYICQGEIRIRGDHTKIFMALRQMSVGPIEFHKDGVPLGRVEHSNDVCSGCYRFRKKVCFFVRHPSESITISMTMDDSRRHISGFPQTTSWFSQQQYLNHPFYSERLDPGPSSQTCPCLLLEEARSVGLVKRKLSSIYLPTNRTKRTRTPSSI